jgi:predicted nucleic acid-binding Zn ribbon protein
MTNPRQCRECGSRFTAVRADAEFCSTPCRRDWNNRRQKRGAELYDVFMFIRHHRKETKALQNDPGINLWTVACQLATQWKAEDERDRGGRKSYQHVPALVVKGQFTHLKAAFIGVDGTGVYNTITTR